MGQFVHALKFQTDELFNGIPGNLAGPYEGQFFVDWFWFVTTITGTCMVQSPTLAYLWVPAYPISMHYRSHFRGANLNDAQDRYNKVMSSVRIS